VYCVSHGSNGSFVVDLLAEIRMATLALFAYELKLTPSPIKAVVIFRWRLIYGLMSLQDTFPDIFLAFDTIYGFLAMEITNLQGL
jgi:hypothetical protein